MAADNITIERIKALHPKVRDEVLKEYTYINEKLLGKGVRLRLAYTYRSPEEQTALYNQGRTTRGSKVTNAKAWQSIHQYGLAFDIVILLDKNGDGVFEEASWDILKDFDKDGKSDWKEITDHFKNKGWAWGGDWQSLKDYPHFEKRMGYSVSELKSKIDNGDFKTEVVNGVKIKYVNI